MTGSPVVKSVDRQLGTANQHLYADQTLQPLSLPHRWRILLPAPPPRCVWRVKCKTLCRAGALTTPPTMARYKTLRSAVHNHAHSVLSAMNYVGGAYFVDEIAQKARAAGAFEVKIDWLTGKVSPVSDSSDIIQRSIAQHRSWLPEHFARMDTSLDLVRSLVMKLTINIDESSTEPRIECIMELRDDRGREYRIPVEPIQPIGAA
jgi:hypothetical protein